MSVVLGQEWLTSNAFRAYPIKEDSTRVPVDSSGTTMAGILIPNYLIVDLVMTTAQATPIRVYLSQVACLGTLVTLGFADESGLLIALVSIDTRVHVKNTGYAITGTGAYQDVRGRVVLGDLSNLTQDLPEGLYTFNLSATEFEPTTIRPDIRGVRSLQLSAQGTESQYIQGAVKLVAGTNVNLTYLAGINGIRIDALSGDGMNAQCDCRDIGQDTTVKTINGIPVEDVIITGDGSCVNVTTSGNRIVISDTCSKPCCGCTELEFITNSLKVLDTTVVNLQTYSNLLASRIETFVNNFILTIM